MMTDRELDHLAQQAALETEFPGDEGGSVVLQGHAYRTSIQTPEEREAAYAARVRSGYYVPGEGAFDDHEGPLAHMKHTRDVPDRPFHIGSSRPATMIACTHCGGTAFEVGYAEYFLALRCLGCLRESCGYSG